MSSAHFMIYVITAIIKYFHGNIPYAQQDLTIEISSVCILQDLDNRTFGAHLEHPVKKTQ